jgi:hypothetical protein
MALDNGGKFHDLLVSSRASLRATLFRIIARRGGKLHMFSQAEHLLARHRHALYSFQFCESMRAC